MKERGHRSSECPKEKKPAMEIGSVGEETSVGGVCAIAQVMVENGWTVEKPMNMCTEKPKALNMCTEKTKNEKMMKTGSEKPTNICSEKLTKRSIRSEKPTIMCSDNLIKRGICIERPTNMCSD